MSTALKNGINNIKAPGYNGGHVVCYFLEYSFTTFLVLIFLLEPAKLPFLKNLNLTSESYSLPMVDIQETTLK